MVKSFKLRSIQRGHRTGGYSRLLNLVLLRNIYLTKRLNHVDVEKVEGDLSTT